MIWEVSAKTSEQSVFGYLIEADTIQEAIHNGEKYGVVIEAKLSETMNDWD